MNNAELGKAIKIQRIKVGISQKEIAAALGITAPAYSNYEAGRRNISVETLMAISNALDVPVESLIPDTDTAADTEEANKPESGNALEVELLKHFRQLNHTGKHEAVKRTEELALIKKYTEEE